MSMELYQSCLSAFLVLQVTVDHLNVDWCISLSVGGDVLAQFLNFCLLHDILMQKCIKWKYTNPAYRQSYACILLQVIVDHPSFCKGVVIIYGRGGFLILWCTNASEETCADRQTDRRMHHSVIPVVWQVHHLFERLQKLDPFLRGAVLRKFKFEIDGIQDSALRLQGATTWNRWSTCRLQDYN